MTTALLTRPVPPIVDDIGRRGFLTGLGAAGLLAGCTTSGPTDTGTVPAAGYPRTVTHPGGTTTFAGRPTRVVSEGPFGDLDNLLALRIPVIARGSGNYDVQDGAADPRADLTSWQLAAGAADVPLNQGVYGTEPNLEEFLRLGADALFVTQANFAGVDDAYRRREQVVPTVIVPDGLDGLRVVADVFALPATDVDARIADARRAFDAFAPARIPTSITAFYFFDDGTFNVASTQNPVNDLLLDPLGLPRLRPQGDEAYPPFQVISTELTAQLDADLLLALNDDNFPGALDKLEQDPLFRALPAVRDGRYRRLSSDFTVAFNRPTVLSIDTAIAGFNDVLAS